MSAHDWAHVATCGNKKAFSSKPLAEFALKWMMRHGHLLKNHTAHTYRCPYCQRWHLGHEGTFKVQIPPRVYKMKKMQLQEREEVYYGESTISLGTY